MDRWKDPARQDHRENRSEDSLSASIRLHGNHILYRNRVSSGINHFQHLESA